MPNVRYFDYNRCQNIKVKEFSYMKWYSQSLIYLIAERIEPHISRLWLFRLKWKKQISFFFFLIFRLKKSKFHSTFNKFMFACV